MTKLEAPETPPPGTDARCTQLFGGGGGATESPPHASRHRKPRSASRGLTRIDSGRTRSRKRRRAARKVKSSRVFARASSRSKFRDHWPHPWSPFLRERKSPLLLVLRFSHVFFGALWVGMMAFQTFFLMPALAEVGPESGKFMAALMRRRLPVILPIVALITLVSGFWLFQRVSGGAPAGLMRTPMGLAFLLGIVVMRPAMMQSTALQQSLASASPEERATRSAEIQRLRARGAMTGWVVMILLLYA